MAKTSPPPGFSSRPLEWHTVQKGEAFGRIYLGRYPDALGFGKSPSRFSDPRRLKDSSRFGVLYLGATLKVCFLEAVLRDQRDGLTGDLPIHESEFDERQYAEIEVAERLRLVDLRADRAVRMGIPSDVARASDQALSRKWSLALHEHNEMPDGIIYPSRLNGETNLAIYDRAVAKLRLLRKSTLKSAPGLPSVLNDLLVSMI
ncbi:MAG: RES family NAD+ phosphorylase [Rhizorhabdus sp.]|uniref:RES family NAD+ phosphorylase n=1 Tax=Rhizorhabdus sp. TaxID=1968843 RepID=UPI001B7BB0C4|nr:RES family NAD+ phosphorylase [Rhizorhabdus sp.]MBP8232126.1 RES family NAD+ phosphorylase [Rhizorhabdus sp.]